MILDLGCGTTEDAITSQTEGTIWKWVGLSLLVWFALGFFDLWSGFVESSPLRVGLLLGLAALLFPWDRLPILRRVWKIRSNGYWSLILLLILALAGYALFLTRYLRGANMADDGIFQRVIENSAYGCPLCYQGFGGTGTYFIAHNNIFLILFVPLTLLPNWWLIVHLIQSVVIVAWCRICGWAIAGTSGMGWLVTMSLFLATYTQHAAFYDTRFAALALVIFACGFYLNRKRWIVTSGLVGLLTRETFGLTVSLMSTVGVFSKRAKGLFVFFSFLGLGWWIGSYGLMFMAGGPIPPRFDSCLFVSLKQLPSLDCVLTSLSSDWQLKLAYTLRLLRYAPSLGAIPSMIAALPDFGLTWLSKDNVLYSLGWHYYMQTIGIFLVGTGLTLRASKLGSLQVRWIIASSIWQFATLFRPNLF